MNLWEAKMMQAKSLHSFFGVQRKSRWEVYAGPHMDVADLSHMRSDPQCCPWGQNSVAGATCALIDLLKICSACWHSSSVACVLHYLLFIAVEVQQEGRGNLRKTNADFVKSLVLLEFRPFRALKSSFDCIWCPFLQSADCKCESAAYETAFTLKQSQGTIGKWNNKKAGWISTLIGALKVLMLWVMTDESSWSQVVLLSRPFKVKKGILSLLLHRSATDNLIVLKHIVFVWVRYC